MAVCNFDFLDIVKIHIITTIIELCPGFSPPKSAFEEAMESPEEWEKFRNIDMDKQVNKDFLLGLQHNSW